MLIDDVTIDVTAGNGGKGAVAFDRNLQALGPAGGSGGKGGSVYFEGVFDLGALHQFRFKKKIAAKNGTNGKGQFCDGPDSDDVILKVPVGTVIHNLNTNVTEEITAIGERTLAAQGGKGGRGNFHFKSSRNTSPTQFQTGLPGETFAFRLELKLIADVGFIGFPNAGKSSLLNELTNAQSKVANYPFTTLEPNLGAYYELIIADVPGLIEGASENKGLGIKFLRHIERTKTLFHLISAESEDPAKDYAIIRKELGAHSETLLRKKEYLFLSKSDCVSPGGLAKKLTVLKKINPSCIPISIHDMDSIEAVKKILNEIAEEKHVKKDLA